MANYYTPFSLRVSEELLDKVGASRLIATKNVPGLGYAGKIQ